MGNWSEEDLMKAAPGTDFGIMPLPTSNNAKAYGNNSISVGVPGYFMIDNQQSKPEQRAGAIDFLTWLYLSPAGQKLVSGAPAAGGMNFIPVYKGTTVKATTFMANEISTYVKANRALEWMNTYYPAGGQELYGASGQKFITDNITSEQYAAELEKAWKGSVKTWRGAKK
jgi:raffinose/stachyose/melibiose transport system substrate-binding protein